MVKKISDNNTKQYLGMHSNELVKRGLHCHKRNHIKAHCL